MRRHTRYQGAIVQDGKILLITHKEHENGKSYWLFPGGGREEGETEEECVAREMREETQLEVEVLSLVLDEGDIPGGAYKRRKTYLCKVVGGEAAPGYEPEEDANWYSISEAGWFDLADVEGWGAEVKADPITYAQMLSLQKALGFRD